ncbi:DUF4397 domain-containing protein [Deinococcus yavapaiensis]|uniref:Uncharacterized protein DUF4397 n=1 Tax=Deinococcus yavapaiensis KR-236 TaxID=694435 RepID=A0A318SC89_9DEIO|nr:DUF4397 domain-containing protein [Deinococcus yavapaiensis]PYE54914.1 uncharacterized protein DUF4397 [Deinococcus yavapaiensis KR-236]
MKNIILSALALTVTLAAAQGTTPMTGMNMDTSFVRVVHASPDAPAVDVYVDGTRTVAGAAFKAVTTYGNVKAGRHNVVVTVAGDKSKKVLETNVTLRAGTYYTVAALGKLSNIGLKVFTTTSLNTNKAKARLNVYHLSPGAPNVDVLAVDYNNAKVVSNLAYSNVKTAYVNPMGVNANVVPAGGMQVVKNISGINIAGGKSYSVFAVGVVGGTGDMAFTLIPTEDKVVADSMSAK